MELQCGFKAFYQRSMQIQKLGTGKDVGMKPCENV